MSFSLGPENGTLSVRTGREGAASKAGHDLRLEVTDWRATIDDEQMSLDADAGSLRVREGTGGMQELGPDDIANIEVTVGEDGTVRGRAVIKQSDWGIKQYAILFGALKVADEVEIAIDAGQSR